MRVPLHLHIPSAYQKSLQERDALPDDCAYKIPFAKPSMLTCELGAFVNQTINGGDYWIELRSFSVKQDGFIRMKVSKPCISIALSLKGKVDGHLSGDVPFSMLAKTYTIFYLPAGMQRVNMSRGEYVWLSIVPPRYYLKHMALEHPGMKDIIRRLLTKQLEGAFLTHFKMPPILRRILREPGKNK